MDQPNKGMDGQPEQTWGQGEGKHEPTIPDDDDTGEEPRSHTGETTRRDDPDASSRDDEGMNQ
jgi:hypothetical protein